MPTTARLAAAICFAILGWVAAQSIRGLMPPDTAFGWFNEVNAGLGLLIGWISLGGRAGRGWSAAIGNGLTAVIALVFWGVFIQAIYRMLISSMRRMYDGVGEAIGAVFEISFNYLLIMASPQVWGTLIIGGILSGLIVEAVSRRWT